MIYFGVGDHMSKSKNPSIYSSKYPMLSILLELNILFNPEEKPKPKLHRYNDSRVSGMMEHSGMLYRGSPHLVAHTNSEHGIVS